MPYAVTEEYDIKNLAAFLPFAVNENLPVYVSSKYPPFLKALSVKPMTLTYFTSFIFLTPAIISCRVFSSGLLKR